MEKIYKSLKVAAVALVTLFGFSSCEDYLDKDADSNVSPETAFTNFTNMQGYVEEIYNCIPDKAKCYWTTAWNLGDDEIQNPQADGIIIHRIDLGDFYAWQNNDQFWFAANKSGLNPTSTDAFNHRLYGHAWYCIAKANQGLENIDKYFTGTEEESNFIKGQLYFFRGWWHFEMMQFLGGLPYVDKVLTPDEASSLKRLSYVELADKIAEDFRRAADLLPNNWDNTATGRRTAGKNELRITKVCALSYLGKNYLWAASPLMQHGAQTGGAKTYDYSAEYAEKAAEALGEAITHLLSGETPYKFAEFNYSNVYDHTKKAGVETSYSEIFFTTGRSWLQPGGSEAILRGPSNGWSYTRFNYSRTFGPNPLCAQDNHIHQPTANYVANYGMANGYPLDDATGEWDITHPFKGRDPRFYHDIVFDGVKYINGDPKEDKAMKYAGLATGGSMRAVANASRTGYFYQKLVPHTCQKYDGADDYGPNPHAYIPYLRLSDVYLMYAEACAAWGGRDKAAKSCPNLTAAQAIEVVRSRPGLDMPGVPAEYTGNKFMDEVRRERAVELAFEGFRFNDLQRWLLLTEPKYVKKTSQEFIRVEDESFFASEDPADARVAEFREEEILTRNFGTKHYWFPLLRNDTYINADIEQNPGW